MGRIESRLISAIDKTPVLLNNFKVEHGCDAAPMKKVAVFGNAGGGKVPHAEYLNTTMVQALLFDLGGVLIDIDFRRALRNWAAISSLSFEELQEAFHHDLPYQRHETGELGAKEYFDCLRVRLKLDGSDRQIAAGWNSIFVGEIAETVEAVRKARAHYPCYVFTNSNPTHQAAWRCRFPDVVAAFDRVFVSSEIGLRKPERAAFAFVAREIGVAAGSILFFDDLLENVSGALDAGLLAVHVRGPADVQDALRRLGCAL